MLEYRNCVKNVMVFFNQKTLVKFIVLRNVLLQKLDAKAFGLHQKLMKNITKQKEGWFNLNKILVLHLVWLKVVNILQHMTFIDIYPVIRVVNMK